MTTYHLTCKYCNNSHTSRNPELVTKCQKCNSKDYTIKKVVKIDTYTVNSVAHTPIDTYEGTPAFRTDEDIDLDEYYGFTD